jgi:transmembrane sensor
MTQPTHQDSVAEAIGWHIRLKGNRPEDWEGFVCWLEENPDRSDAYDAVALADAALHPEMLPPPPPSPAANDDGQLAWEKELVNPPRRRWATALAAIAAVLLFGLFAMPWLNPASTRYEIATPAGEQRIVAIGGGDTVALNGSTRLVLDRADARYAELAAGEATFTVSHDPARPFVVVAGNHRVQDAGTVFNLVSDAGRFSVETVEGAVVYDPQGAAIAVPAGQTLLVSGKDNSIVLGRKEPDMIAGWRRGQLSYREEPLNAVARDLTRAIGAEVRIDPALASVLFTGSIRIDRDDGATVTRVASALGVTARSTGEGWLIEPGQRALR